MANNAAIAALVCVALLFGAAAFLLSARPLPATETTSSFRLASTIQLSTSTPTIVQNTFTTFTSGTSGTLAFASNVGAKNTIVVCQGQSSTSAFTSLNNIPTDTLGLIYTQIGLASALNDAVMVCFGATTIVSGADTITSATYGTTCAAGNLCTLFINEIHGSSRGMIITKTGSSTSTTTSPTCSQLGSSETPLLLAFYQKTTTGTDTAGTNFNLLNGETGSLLYLTQFANTLTHVFTTWPATFGTASAFAGVCMTVPEATVGWTISLAANTNYYVSINGGLGSVAGGITSNAGFTIGQLDSGASLVLLCQFGVSANSQGCATTTDTYPLTIAGIVATGSVNSYSLWGTITVGSTPTTLNVYFDCSIGNGGAVPQCQLNAGSIVLLTTVS